MLNKINKIYNWNKIKIQFNKIIFFSKKDLLKSYKKITNIFNKIKTRKF